LILPESDSCEFCAATCEIGKKKFRERFVMLDRGGRCCYRRRTGNTRQKIGAGMSSFHDAPDSRPDFAYPAITPEAPVRGRLPAPSAGRLRKVALLAGTVAVAALMLAQRPPAPAPAPAASVAVSTQAVAAPRPAAAPGPSQPAVAPKPAAPVRLARAEPPPRRPTPQPVTVSTRNPPLLSTKDRLELAGPKPLPRPAVVETARIATPVLDADRPMRRPDAGDTVRAAVEATARAAEGRPLPRPAAPAPLVVASLSPAPAEMALAAVVAAPRARPEAPTVAARVAPAPRAAQPAKPAAAPAAKVVRGPAPAARIAPAAKVATQAPLRVVPVAAPAARQPVRAAPARVATLAPAKPRAVTPATARPKVVAQKPVRTARKPAAERAGLSRGNVSLIGVFGGEDGRHALLLMPDGSIERVRPGDRVRGAQVAAIGAESVRLSGRGRDTLLRLPD
jgi:hypothetical protein